MNKQISFANLNDRSDKTKVHGGSLAPGKRKSKRPLDRRRPIHLVLKTTNSHTLLWNQKAVNEILNRTAAKFGIKLHSSAVQCDHIHLHLNFQNRKVYVMWIRALTGTLVQKVAGIKFKFIPFTRVVESWSKDFKSIQSYIEKNQKEADFLFRIHNDIEMKRKWLLRHLACIGFTKL